MTEVNDAFWDRMLGPKGSPERIEADADVARMQRREEQARRLTYWMRHIPYLGKLASCFWYLVLTEGKPFDGLIFSFLNDGMRPTLWHTWLQMRSRSLDEPFAGIWPGGAPRDRQDAYAKTVAAALRACEE